jgi:hypothetical protein
VREEIFFDDSRQVFFVDFDLALDETLIFVGCLTGKTTRTFFIVQFLFWR